MITLTLDNITLFGYHGFFDVEHQIGTWYDINITLDLAIPIEKLTDALTDTLDYQLVYDTVKSTFAIEVKTIEYLAKCIKQNITNLDPRISNCKVALTKKNPPLGGKMNGVTVII